MEKTGSVRTSHHKVVIIGGGTAGISVAARLRKALKNKAYGLPWLYWYRGMLKGRA
jgi:cation diffusion facilitator CzcD-associated flavoprotein CzcO